MNSHTWDQDVTINALLTIGGAAGTDPELVQAVTSGGFTSPLKSESLLLPGNLGFPITDVNYRQLKGETIFLGDPGGVTAYLFLVDYSAESSQ